MSINLVDSVKGLFTSDTVSAIAASTGESENAIQKAINGAVPASLLGLLNKAANHGNAGAPGILDLARQVSNSSILGNLKALTAGRGGSGIFSTVIDTLFGDKLNGIIKTISGFAGIRESSAYSVLNVTAPATLATLGNQAHVTNMNTRDLLFFLKTQQDSIIKSVPAGLNLAGALGIGSVDSMRDKISSSLSVVAGSSKKVVGNATDFADDTIRTATKGKTVFGWIMLPLLVVTVILWLVIPRDTDNGLNTGVAGQETGVQQPDTTKTNQNIAAATVPVKGTLDSLGNFVYDPGDVITIDLPNNSGKLTVGENSTETKLARFLNDKNGVLDTVKGNWFELTNVRFKTGSTEVTNESMAQLRNIVAIAKAYPNAQFKLGGYTDNTGDSVKNVALSQQRAETVVVWLRRLGMAPTSLVDAKGYGPQFPLSDNATAEGRAMNRRVALNVKAR